mgnify:FL=1
MSRIAKSTLIIAFFFGIDKILGFYRALKINQHFGLSYELDVFNVANNIPDLLSALISGGALGVALIPVLSEYIKQKGKPSAWELFSRILNFAFITTGLIAILISIFAPWLVDKIIAPGFPYEQKLLTVELLRFDLLAILIFSISGLVMAGLQANQHFLFPAMAPGFYNLGQIFGILVLAPSEGLKIGSIPFPAYGLGIRGLVYGVILGAFLHLTIQVPGLIIHKFKWTPKVDLKNPGVKKVLALLGPRVITMLFIQMFFIVRDNLASGLGEGSVSALNLGWFIMQVPETLLGTAVAIAFLPTISEIFIQGDKNEFMEMVNKAIRALIGITIPVAFLMAVGLKPLIIAAFPSFTQEGVALVLIASRIYLLGLTSHALLEITSRSFYAQQDAKTPLIAAAINAFLYFGLAVFLSRSLEIAGIAWANTIAFTTETLLLLYLLNRRYPGLARVKNTFLKIVLSSGLGALIFDLILQLDQLSTYSPLVQAAISTGLMGLVFILLIPVIWPELRPLVKSAQK